MNQTTGYVECQPSQQPDDKKNEKQYDKHPVDLRGGSAAALSQALSLPSGAAAGSKFIAAYALHTEML
jgi:hypothetical protein